MSVPLVATPSEHVAPVELAAVRDDPRPSVGPPAPATPEPGKSGEARLSDRLRSGAFWVTAGRMAGIGVTMLVNIVLARWLSPADFGSFLLTCSVLALGSVLAMQGLNSAVVRFVADRLGPGEAPRARQALRLIALLATVSVLTVACLMSVVLALADPSILGLPRTGGLAALIVVGVVLLAIVQLLAEACRGLHDVRLASLFSGGQTGGLLSNLLFLGLLVAAVGLARPNLTTALALNVAAIAMAVPLAAAALRLVARERLGAVQGETIDRGLTARQLLAFSLPMLGVQLLTLVTAQADLWIAGVFCPHDQLALYGAARRLLLLVTMPLQIANITVLASIAELYAGRQHAELERVLRRATTLAAAPSLAAIAVLVLGGGPILSLLFGPFFAAAALPLGILGIGQFCLVAVGSCGCALEMSGFQLTSLAVNFVAAIALAVLGSWAARHYGIVGLATASSGVVAVQSASLWLLARRLVGVWTHPAPGALRGLLSWRGAGS